jgi:protein-S-isoprenylcysteine O-methyltransferase Ste14
MAKTQEISEDTKTLITVLLLVFAYPVGLVMMFVWTKWPGWVKVLIVLPFVVGTLFFFLLGGIIFSAITSGIGEVGEMEYNYTMETSGEGSNSGEFVIEE